MKLFTPSCILIVGREESKISVGAGVARNHEKKVHRASWDVMSETDTGGNVEEKALNSSFLRRK